MQNPDCVLQPPAYASKSLELIRVSSDCKSNLELIVIVGKLQTVAKSCHCYIALVVTVSARKLVIKPYNENTIRTPCSQNTQRSSHYDHNTRRSE